VDLPLISHPTRNDETATYDDSELTARGDLRLTAHSQAVATRATDLFGAGSGDEASFLQAAAALHDFGKATPQFQTYVRPEETADCPDEETTHARLGALATWYVLGKVGAPCRDRLAATLAVARHHQALPNAAQYTAETLASAFEEEGAIDAQLEAIDATWPSAAAELLAQTPLDAPEWHEFYTWAKSGTVSDELRGLSARETLASYTIDTDKLPERLYDRALRYWSAITLADKTHAADIPEEYVFDLDTLDGAAIERYVGTLRETGPDDGLVARLNDERERARRQAVRGVHEWLDRDTPVATLTLPTGLGKTLTGLSAAFEARDRLTPRAGGRTPRQIVYALPYTSIIEQTRSLFEEPDLWGADPTASALTVHHHLNETVVNSGEYEAGDTAATDDGTAALLGEAWRDGTILTTFVQLFESLTGPTNGQGLKLPALESSIVILDEPQALPKDWWGGIQRLLDVLTDEYSARILAMTATQPSLVRERDTVSLLAAGRDHTTADCRECPVVDDRETTLSPVPQSRYFGEAERVRYTIDETALSRQPGVDESRVDYETAADRILGATEPGASSLAVCNTIDSSVTLTEELLDRPGVTHLGESIEAVLAERDTVAAGRCSDASAVAEEAFERAMVTEGGTSSRTPGREPRSGSPVDVEKENLSDTDSTYLLTLNSRYRPFDREVLIELADTLSTSDHEFILVSTQAIEAGVDLSFQTVFRDVAPLDSIVQAAGRCNRSYEWGESGGEVIVWLLDSPNDASEPPAYYVYERGATEAGIPEHLEIISEVLAGLPDPTDVADEMMAATAVTEYFDRIENKSLWSGDLRDAIDDANVGWLGHQSMIGGKPTLDVLVGVTDADCARIDEISELCEECDGEGGGHNIAAGAKIPAERKNDFVKKLDSRIQEEVVS